MTQLDITGAAAVAPVDVRLTARQRLALEHIAAHAPVTSDELGAYLCERRGKHAADVRCQWCTAAGKEVGASLRRKGLVKLRRDAGWEPTRTSTVVAAGEGEIPY